MGKKLIVEILEMQIKVRDEMITNLKNDIANLRKEKSIEIETLKNKLPLRELSLNDLRDKAWNEYGIEITGKTKSDIVHEIQCEQLDLKKIVK